MSLSNLFSHIQNGQRNNLLVIKHPKSKITRAVLKVMLENGYIRGFRDVKEGMGANCKGDAFQKESFEILLKYNQNKPVINKIKLVSKPSRKVFKSLQDIEKLWRFGKNRPSLLGGF